jgi:hypothetical protein
MALAFCESTQSQIKKDYPDLKVADLCPGCGVKICFHKNYIQEGS